MKWLKTCTVLAFRTYLEKKQSTLIISKYRKYNILPVHECAFGIHEVELVVQPCPGFGNGRGIRKHTDSPLYSGQITALYCRWGLVVDSNLERLIFKRIFCFKFYLESSGAPIDKLDGAFGFDLGDGGVDVLGHNISSVKETTSHVFSLPGIAFDLF